jgi:DNA-binding Lrp family transcriptional regulator
MPLNVTDPGANLNEYIRHAAQAIGRSKDRRILFEEIYRGKKAIKPVPDLAAATGLSEKRVLEEGQKLAANNIVEKVKVKGRVAYKKDATYSHHKAKVLDLVAHPEKKDRYPTKQEPRASGRVSYEIKLARSNPQPQEITVDEIESFAAVRAVASGTADLSKVLENDVKQFLNRVMGEANEFTDWGGEKNDIYTSRLRFRGARRTAAFAIKGRATRGTLTPGKMGTNGDQIARLFASDASVFFVVYHGKVAESIHEQMRAYGIARALTGNRVYYCVIDGNDLGRLAAAYGEEFAAASSA